MAIPKRQRIFISYAHHDGGDLAGRLQCDLQALGFDVWLDRLQLKGGDPWTNEIEDALARAQVVLALLSDGSFVSDTCRAEQGIALDAGKRVIPLRVHRGCMVQLRLHEIQYIDFSDATQYDARFQELLASIAKRRTVRTPAPAQPRYNNAPPLPDNFVDRPEMLSALRNALFQDAPNRNIALTALQGMGGIGKTVLAQALCHDEVVQQAYPDGIFWFPIGKESRLTFDQRVESVPGLSRLLGEYDGEHACISQYRNAFRGKAALIVLDDVWHAADVEPFRTESPRSRLLATTRDTGIASTFGAREFTAELPSAGEAHEVLARWAGSRDKPLPLQASELIRECGKLPLALAMIGAQLRGKPLAHWDIVLGHLRRADLSQINARFPEPHTTLFRAIQVSFDALRDDYPVAAERYLALAVTLEEMALAVAVLRTLWNVEEAEALETSDQFIVLSLAHRDKAAGIRLHDLQLDYVRALSPDRAELDLMREAARLSFQVIEKDPYQFGSQMIGRLLPHVNVTAIAAFVQRVANGAPTPWLRPLWPGLLSPGTALFPRSGGHCAGIDAVAMSADGRLVVSGARDEMLKVWDLESGQMLRTLDGHRDYITAIAITPDGRRAISAAWNDSLKLWDLETGQVLRTLAGNQSVAISDDGKRAVSAASENKIKLWDLETGDEVRVFAGHSDAVNSISVTGDWRRAISASSDHTLIVWDLETGQRLSTLAGHRSDVWAVVTSPDGRYAISASDDKTLKVWDLHTASEICTMKGHKGPVYGVAVSGDWRRAVSASHDKTLKVWDLATRRAIRTLKGHDSFVYNVALSSNGLLAVSASDDTSLTVWDAERGLKIRTLQGQSLALDCPVISADRRKAVFASGDGTLKVWSLQTGCLIGSISAHTGSASGLAASADARRAFSASWAGVLKVWDLNAEREMGTLMSRSSDIWCIAVSGDGRRGASASDDGSVAVWDLEELREIRTIEVRSGAVYGVALNTDGRWAVAAAEDNTLRVFDTASGRQVSALIGHSEPINGVAISPDERYVVSASQDYTLKVWNSKTGQSLRTLIGHSDAVNSVAVSPNSRCAISASDDKTLRLWDLDSGALVTTFTCDAAASCAFVNDREIIAGDDAGRVHLLSLVGDIPESA